MVRSSPRVAIGVLTAQRCLKPSTSCIQAKATSHWVLTQDGSNGSMTIQPVQLSDNNDALAPPPKSGELKAEDPEFVEELNHVRGQRDEAYDNLEEVNEELIAMSDKYEEAEERRKQAEAELKELRYRMEVQQAADTLRKEERSHNLAALHGVEVKAFQDQLSLAYIRIGKLEAQLATAESHAEELKAKREDLASSGNPADKRWYEARILELQKGAEADKLRIGELCNRIYEEAQGFEQRIIQLDGEVEEQKGVIQGLQGESEGYKERVRWLEAEAEGYKQRIDELEGVIEDNKDEMHELERDADDYQERIAELETEQGECVLKLRSKLRAVEQGKLQAKLKAAEQRVEELTSELKDAGAPFSGRITGLEHEVELLQGRVKELQETEVQQEAGVFKAKASKAKARVAELEGELKALEEKYHSAKKQAKADTKDLQAKLEALQAGVKDLAKEKAELQKKLKTAQKRPGPPSLRPPGPMHLPAQASMPLPQPIFLSRAPSPEELLRMKKLSFNVFWQARKAE